MQTNIHEAKSKLSQLIERAIKGEDVVIAKAGIPCVDLVPHRSKKTRAPGHYQGEIQIDPDFDKTPNDIINNFYGAA